MKKYFIGVLAALMLFAFTACDNSVPTVSIDGVAYVEVEQVKNYLEGEKATEDGFQIVVNYTVGSPKIIAGNAGNIDIAGDVASVKGIQFYDANGKEVPAVGTSVTYTPVTSVSVNVSSIEIEEGSKLEDGFGIVDPAVLADATFTLSGDGVSKTYTFMDVATKKIDVVLSLWNENEMLATSTAVEKGETYTVTLDKYDILNDGETHTSGKWDADFTNNGLTAGLSTGVTVSVVEKSVTAPVTLSSIVVTQNADNEVFVIANDATNTDKVSDLEYTVVGSFSNGTTKTLSSAAKPEDPSEVDVNTDYGWTIGILNYTTGSALTNGMNIIVYATKGSDYAEGSFAVRTTADYAKSVEIGIGKVQGESGEVARTWAPGNDILPAQFTYTVKSWASGHDYSKDTGVAASMLTLPSDDFAVNPRMVPNGYGSSSMAVNFSYVGDIEGLVLTRSTELSSGITVKTN